MEMSNLLAKYRVQRNPNVISFIGGSWDIPKNEYSRFLDLLFYSAESNKWHFGEVAQEESRMFLDLDNCKNSSAVVLINHIINDIFASPPWGGDWKGSVAYNDKGNMHVVFPGLVVKRVVRREATRMINSRVKNKTRLFFYNN